MVLGIVVDDAIIVVENIKRYIQKGIEPAKAAIMGAQEVAWPVIATVLTNIASLFPILLAEGTLGIFSIYHSHCCDICINFFFS